MTEDQNKKYASQNAMLPEEVDRIVEEISSAMQKNEIEIEATWFPVGGKQNLATTWRGIAEDTGDQENPIIVSYPWGKYPLPNNVLVPVTITVKVLINNNN